MEPLLIFLYHEYTIGQYVSMHIESDIGSGQDITYWFSFLQKNGPEFKTAFEVLLCARKKVKNIHDSVTSFL